MNKILLPQVTFKNIVADEKRIEAAYAKIFEMARRNILAKRLLTKPTSQEYIKVQDEKTISNNKGSGKNVKSK